jgi:hypothetical protein
MMLAPRTMIARILDLGDSEEDYSPASNGKHGWTQTWQVRHREGKHHSLTADHAHLLQQFFFAGSAQSYSAPVFETMV